MDAGSTEAAASAQDGQHNEISITETSVDAGPAEAGNPNTATSNNGEAPGGGPSKPAVHANNNNNNNNKQGSEEASSKSREVDHPSEAIAASTEASAAAPAPATMSSVRFPRACQAASLTLDSYTQSLATFEQVLLKQEKKKELSLSQKLVKALCLAQMYVPQGRRRRRSVRSACVIICSKHLGGVLKRPASVC